MKNLNLENLEMNGLVSMTNEEFEAINGGYSWAEFKQDCANTWNEVKSSFSSGFSSGSAGADATK